MFSRYNNKSIEIMEVNMRILILVLSITLLTSFIANAEPTNIGETQLQSTSKAPIILQEIPKQNCKKADQELAFLSGSGTLQRQPNCCGYCTDADGTSRDNACRVGKRCVSC